MMGLSLSVRRLWQGSTSRGIVLITVVLLACLLGVAVTECHIAPTEFNHQHARTTRHPHSATGHSSLDFHCLVAILSSGIISVYLLSVVLLATPQSSPSIAPVFPLFKPPRF